jgi:hypothetical protein
MRQKKTNISYILKSGFARLRNNLGLGRILNRRIYIVIRALELQVELQLRFFQLQVRLQLNETSKPLDLLCDLC